MVKGEAPPAAPDDAGGDGEASGKSDATVLLPYWERIAAEHAGEDGLAAICYPGMPAWFNRFHDYFQRRAVARALAGVTLSGQRCLDVGCGAGRWTRWLAARGGSAIGIDPTASMLECARRTSPQLDFRRMSATALDFAAASFDVVLAITVVQHLEHREQERAAAELARVLKPGGRLLVVDLIDARDPGRIVFPRPAPGWIDLYSRAGLSLESWRGQDFVPLIRVPAALLRGRKGTGEAVTAPTILERAARSPRLLLPLWPVILASYPLEFLSEAVLPASWARHGCFVFRRPG